MAASPERPDLAFDGDEEPLFADDLDDFGDDDIGTLPPLMPTLEELAAEQARISASRVGGGALPGQTSGQGTVPGFTSGDGTNQTGTGNAPNDVAPPPKKKRPVLTLKIDRIFSDKGLKYIHTEFPKLKFKGKRHERSDLKHLMKQYEQWANMLYPKMTFSDVTDRIEALAKKKEFKTNLIRMRRQQIRGGADTPPLSDTEELNDPPPNTVVNTHTPSVPEEETTPPVSSQMDTLSPENQPHENTTSVNHSPVDTNNNVNTEIDFDFDF